MGDRRNQYNYETAHSHHNVATGMGIPQRPQGDDGIPSGWPYLPGLVPRSQYNPFPTPQSTAASATQSTSSVHVTPGRQTGCQAEDKHLTQVEKFLEKIKKKKTKELDGPNEDKANPVQGLTAPISAAVTAPIQPVGGKVISDSMKRIAEEYAYDDSGESSQHKRSSDKHDSGKNQGGSRERHTAEVSKTRHSTYQTYVRESRKSYASAEMTSLEMDQSGKSRTLPAFSLRQRDDYSNSKKQERVKSATAPFTSGSDASSKSRHIHSFDQEEDIRHEGSRRNNSVEKERQSSDDRDDPEHYQAQVILKNLPSNARKGDVCRLLQKYEAKVWILRQGRNDVRAFVKVRDADKVWDLLKEFDLSMFMGCKIRAKPCVSSDFEGYRDEKEHKVPDQEKHSKTVMRARSPSPPPAPPMSFQEPYPPAPMCPPQVYSHYPPHPPQMVYSGVEYMYPPPPLYPPPPTTYMIPIYRVYMGNLPHNITQDQLTTFIESYNYTQVEISRANNVTFAHLDFNSLEEANHIVAMLDQQYCYGEQIHVCFVDPNEQIYSGSLQDMGKDEGGPVNVAPAELSLFKSYVDNQYAYPILIGLKYVHEFVSQQNERGYYVCEICREFCKGKAIADHITGHKHRLRYFKQHAPKVYSHICLIQKKDEMVRACERYANDHVTSNDAIHTTIDRDPETRARNYLSKILDSCKELDMKRRKEKEKESKSSSSDSTSNILKKIQAYKEKLKTIELGDRYSGTSTQKEESSSGSIKSDKDRKGRERERDRRTTRRTRMTASDKKKLEEEKIKAAEEKKKKNAEEKKIEEEKKKKEEEEKKKREEEEERKVEEQKKRLLEKAKQKAEMMAKLAAEQAEAERKKLIEEAKQKAEEELRILEQAKKKALKEVRKKEDEVLQNEWMARTLQEVTEAQEKAIKMAEAVALKKKLEEEDILSKTQEQDESETFEEEPWKMELKALADRIEMESKEEEKLSEEERKRREEIRQAELLEKQRAEQEEQKKLEELKKKEAQKQAEIAKKRRLENERMKREMQKMELEEQKRRKKEKADKEEKLKREEASLKKELTETKPQIPVIVGSTKVDKSGQKPFGKVRNVLQVNTVDISECNVITNANTDLNSSQSSKENMMKDIRERQKQLKPVRDFNDKFGIHPMSKIDAILKQGQPFGPEGDVFVGLEHITEILPDSLNMKNYLYFCQCCHLKVTASSCRGHIVGYKHRMAYLSKKSPEIHLQLSQKDVARGRLNQECLKVAQEIVATEGYHQVLTVTTTEFQALYGEGSIEMPHFIQSRSYWKLALELARPVGLEEGRDWVHFYMLEEFRKDSCVLGLSHVTEVQGQWDVKGQQQGAVYQCALCGTLSPLTALSMYNHVQGIVHKLAYVDVQDKALCLSMKKITNSDEQLRALAEFAKSEHQKNGCDAIKVALLFGEYLQPDLQQLATEAMFDAQPVKISAGSQSVKLFQLPEFTKNLKPLGLRHLTELQGVRKKVKLKCSLCDTAWFSTPLEAYQHLTDDQHVYRFILLHEEHRANILKKVSNLPIYKQRLATFAQNIIREKGPDAIRLAVIKGPKEIPNLDMVAKPPELKPKVKLYEMLWKLKEVPIVGLGSIIELQGLDEKVLPRYQCRLCDTTTSGQLIICHLTSLDHRIKYLRVYYPALHVKAEGKRDKVEACVQEIGSQFGWEDVSFKKMLSSRPDGNAVYTDAEVVQAPYKGKQCKSTWLERLETLDKFFDSDKPAKKATVENNPSAKTTPQKPQKKPTQSSAPGSKAQTSLTAVKVSPEDASKKISQEPGNKPSNSLLQGNKEPQEKQKKYRDFNDIVKGLTYTPLLGLDYITELIHPGEEEPPIYECLLCGLPRNLTTLGGHNILKHICTRGHRLNFFKHEDRKWYKEKVKGTYKVDPQILDQHTREIVTKVGRGKVRSEVISDQKTWEWATAAFLKIKKSPTTVAACVKTGGESSSTEKPAAKSKAHIASMNVEDLVKFRCDHYLWSAVIAELQHRIKTGEIIPVFNVTSVFEENCKNIGRHYLTGGQWITEVQTTSTVEEPHYLCHLCHQCIVAPYIRKHVFTRGHTLRYLHNMYPQLFEQLCGHNWTSADLDRVVKSLCDEVEIAEKRNKIHTFPQVLLATCPCLVQPISWLKGTMASGAICKADLDLIIKETRGPWSFINLSSPKVPVLKPGRKSRHLLDQHLGASHQARIIASLSAPSAESQPHQARETDGKKKERPEVLSAKNSKDQTDVQIHKSENKSKGHEKIKDKQFESPAREEKKTDVKSEPALPELLGNEPGYGKRIDGKASLNPLLKMKRVQLLKGSSEKSDSKCKEKMEKDGKQRSLMSKEATTLEAPVGLEKRKLDDSSSCSPSKKIKTEVDKLKAVSSKKSVQEKKEKHLENITSDKEDTVMEVSFDSEKQKTDDVKSSCLSKKSTTDQSRPHLKSPEKCVQKQADHVTPDKEGETTVVEVSVDSWQGNMEDDKSSDPSKNVKIDNSQAKNNPSEKSVLGSKEKQAEHAGKEGETTVIEVSVGLDKRKSDDVCSLNPSKKAKTVSAQVKNLPTENSVQKPVQNVSSENKGERTVAEVSVGLEKRKVDDACSSQPSKKAKTNVSQPKANSPESNLENKKHQRGRIAKDYDEGKQAVEVSVDLSVVSNIEKKSFPIDSSTKLEDIVLEISSSSNDSENHKASKEEGKVSESYNKSGEKKIRMTEIEAKAPLQDKPHKLREKEKQKNLVRNTVEITMKTTEVKGSNRNWDTVPDKQNSKTQESVKDKNESSSSGNKTKKKSETVVKTKLVTENKGKMAVDVCKDIVAETSGQTDLKILSTVGNSSHTPDKDKLEMLEKSKSTLPSIETEGDQYSDESADIDDEDFEFFIQNQLGGEFVTVDEVEEDTVDDNFAETIDSEEDFDSVSPTGSNDGPQATGLSETSFKNDKSAKAAVTNINDSSVLVPRTDCNPDGMLEGQSSGNTINSAAKQDSNMESSSPDQKDVKDVKAGKSESSDTDENICKDSDEHKTVELCDFANVADGWPEDGEEEDDVMDWGNFITLDETEDVLEGNVEDLEEFTDTVETPKSSPLKEEAVVAVNPTDPKGVRSDEPRAKDTDKVQDQGIEKTSSDLSQEGRSGPSSVRSGNRKDDREPLESAAKNTQSGSSTSSSRVKSTGKERSSSSADKTREAQMVDTAGLAGSKKSGEKVGPTVKKSHPQPGDPFLVSVSVELLSDDPNKVNMSPVLKDMSENQSTAEIGLMKDETSGEIMANISAEVQGHSSVSEIKDLGTVMSGKQGKKLPGDRLGTHEGGATGNNKGVASRGGVDSRRGMTSRGGGNFRRGVAAREGGTFRGGAAARGRGTFKGGVVARGQGAHRRGRASRGGVAYRGRGVNKRGGVTHSTESSQETSTKQHYSYEWRTGSSSVTSRNTRSQKNKEKCEVSVEIG